MKLTDEQLKIRDILQAEYDKNPMDTNHNFLSRFAIAVSLPLSSTPLKQLSDEEIRNEAIDIVTGNIGACFDDLTEEGRHKAELVMHGIKKGLSLSVSPLVKEEKTKDGGENE